ncbi:MAG TPA: coenzyme F430 synthase, partial [Methanofollis liminatans]|nr:coenzyme F430 synthase [Methanofollis liminatans]
CRETAVAAAAYARALAGSGPLILVIGTEGQTICEGFPADEVKWAIEEIRPDRVVLVGDYPEIEGIPAGDRAKGAGIAEEIANDGGAIVLAVKTWR